MEFALTRKQLNKKREAEGQAPQAPVSYEATAPTPGQPGVDPMTGLPVGYDPPTQQLPAVAPVAAPPPPPGAPVDPDRPDRHLDAELAEVDPGVLQPVRADRRS